MRSRAIAATGLLLGAGLVAALVNPTFAEPVSQAPFRARVVGVYDGDTILIRPEGSSRWMPIRLHGVDAPEYDPPSVQRGGYAAFEYVYRRSYGQQVVVRPVIRDFYNRIVGEVFLADGKMLNTEVVSAGMGWVYRRYMWGAQEAEWLNLEAIARSERKGLWADQNPTAPWVWRKLYY